MELIVICVVFGFGFYFGYDYRKFITRKKSELI